MFDGLKDTGCLICNLLKGPIAFLICIYIYIEINDLIRIKSLMITPILYLSNIGNIKKSRKAAIYIVVALFIYKHNERNKEDVIIKSNHLNK